MKLDNLELEIQILEYYKSKNELTEKGKNTLKEYSLIKEKLILPNVIKALPKRISNIAYSNAKKMSYEDFVKWWDELRYERIN